jgi:hypothetical protein
MPRRHRPAGLPEEIGVRDHRDVGDRYPDEIRFALVGGLLAEVILASVYLIFARNVTVLDANGVRTRLPYSAARRWGWAQVRSVRVETVRGRNGPGRYITITPVTGKPCRLAAPLDTGGMPDPDFSTKADEILRYWSAATQPKPPAPRHGPPPPARRPRTPAMRPRTDLLRHRPASPRWPSSPGSGIG